MKLELLKQGNLALDVHAATDAAAVNDHNINYNKNG